MPDYLPRTEPEFTAWVTNFNNVLANIAGAVGVSNPDQEALALAGAAWSDAATNAGTVQTTLDGALETKAAARVAVTDRIRAAVRQIQANPHVTDEQRAHLGLTIRDTTVTPNLAAPAGRPVGVVDTSERLRHTIDFRDAGTPKSKAKPKGIKGCEIWVKVGTPPSDITGGGDPKDLTFLALDTATPYLAEYAAADANKIAYYMLRWVNTQ